MTEIIKKSQDTELGQVLIIEVLTELKILSEINLPLAMKTLGHWSHTNVSLSKKSGGNPPWVSW